MVQTEETMHSEIGQEVAPIVAQVPVSRAMRWKSADLDLLPNNGKRYEIIDGELLMSKQPHWHHQFVCVQIGTELNLYNQQQKTGQVNFAPGVIFADDDDVVPDVVWISRERLIAALGPEGHLHAAPELAIEVLSEGSANERRDREAKLKLYSRRGVQEYWILNWRMKQIEVFRREAQELRLIATLLKTDTLESPLLPGFSCPVAKLFEDIISNWPTSKETPLIS